MIFRRFKRRIKQIDPDEVFLDATNLPSFDDQQFEGRIEQPIAKKVINVFAVVFLLLGLVFTWRVGLVQLVHGESYYKRSEANKLRHSPVFPDRGLIYDRHGVILAWNEEGVRRYINEEGFGHLLGFVGYPNEDQLKNNNYHPKQLVGKDGVELSFNNQLLGEIGVRMEEVNAREEIQSDHILAEPKSGDNLTLSIDSRIQSAMHRSIKEVAINGGFRGGSGIIMDVESGELIALTNYPEYDPNIIVSATSSEMIKQYNSEANPYLNRAVNGLYTPGSVIKPFLALAALAEKIIDPKKVIMTNGYLRLPNPYNPDKPTIFRDWQNQGPVDMRKAIAVSSNVYFYYIGGGFDGQKGLGISRIESYLKQFGFNEKTGINFNSELSGVIPNPAWKQEKFNEPWLLGDTYHTSIGQYGTLVTPIQVVRGIAAIANDGLLLTPQLSLNKKEIKTKLNLSPQDHLVVKEGMRMTVTDGTTLSLNVPGTKIASKTGTAEIDAGKRYVNSWIVGFFPYDQPKYAFVVVMEQGPRSGNIGGLSAMRNVVNWMNINTPEYFGKEPINEEES